MSCSDHAVIMIRSNIHHGSLAPASSIPPCHPPIVNIAVSGQSRYTKGQLRYEDGYCLSTHVHMCSDHLLPSLLLSQMATVCPHMSTCAVIICCRPCCCRPVVVFISSPLCLDTLAC